MSSCQTSAPLLRSTLPTELDAMIIRQLPLKSLVKAASVCLEFQLEAEVHIYRDIHIVSTWSEDGRFFALRNALVTSPRRQALV